MIRLFEEFTESSDYRIRMFFSELIKNIKHWFLEGAFSQDNINLIGLEESSNVKGVKKYLTFDFEDGEYRYQVSFIINYDMLSEEGVDSVYLSIKKYLFGDSELIRTLEEEVDTDELSETFILNKITEIDEKSQSTLGDTPNTLSDEDADFKDNIH